MCNEKRTIHLTLRLFALWAVCLYRPKWDEKQRVHHGQHNYLDDKKSRKVQPKNAKRILEMFAGVTVRQG